MARILSVVAVLTIGFLSACGGGAPDIDVVERHDMGSIQKGQAASANLIVRNTGKAPLDVQSVSTSCGCTTAVMEPKTIPAGGQGVLRVIYDSNAHAEDMGPIKRYVFVASNDPDEGDVRIEFAVDVLSARPGDGQ
ncbi:DUF1573 domain-containing protein [Shumkonia mesophila]|uniref:DUF1573 domain-containing protein n=1 Tax=Shumkonia mesophila TaxID=2838854 RepID=UPI002934E0DC|nr:DUF1573 domain-containing protein [Shumkonia mesophila]